MKTGKIKPDSVTVPYVCAIGEIREPNPSELKSDDGVWELANFELYGNERVAMMLEPSDDGKWNYIRGFTLPHS